MQYSMFSSLLLGKQVLQVCFHLQGYLSGRDTEGGGITLASCCQSSVTSRETNLEKFRESYRESVRERKIAVDSLYILFSQKHIL